MRWNQNIQPGDKAKGDFSLFLIYLKIKKWYEKDCKTSAGYRRCPKGIGSVPW
jgi:hypothetical protein